MSSFFEWSANEWLNKLLYFSKYLLSKWYYLILGCFIGAVIGYWPVRNAQPTYTATISFVLSTEPSRGNGLSGIASQLGLDAGTSGSDNVFSGENIIELFKSQKVVRKTLMDDVDSVTHQSLLNFIALRQYSTSKAILPFPNDVSKFNKQQNKLFKQIAKNVSESFTVYKKDKRLVFYLINATSTDMDIAYFTAKCLLSQTSQFFIETKTSAALKGLKLLKKEGDSLARAIDNAYRSSASTVDRTYNINPSLTIQRSSAQFNQAKLSALTAAYTEVMRNLELAKINVQKETPLFGIIDESDMPIEAVKVNVAKRVVLMAIIGFLITTICLLVNVVILYKKDK